MLSDLSKDDIRTLRDLLDRIETASPSGSVAVVVMAAADDEFTLSPEDENGTMGLDTTLPDWPAVKNPGAVRLHLDRPGAGD